MQAVDDEYGFYIAPRRELLRFSVPVENGFSVHYGVKAQKPGYFHPYVNVNLFKLKALRIPENAKMEKVSPAMEENMVDRKRKHVEPLKKKPRGFEKSNVYYTHDNGGRPFAVFVNPEKTSIAVYALKSPKYYVWYIDEEKFKKEPWRLYTRHVFTLKNIKRVWIGKSDPVTHCHPPGKWAWGNSVLVQASPFQYYFIADSIYSFTSREQIWRLHSPIGNNDVPYPVAESRGKNGSYFFMLDQTKYPKQHFVVPEPKKSSPTQKDEKQCSKDLYFYFYGHGGPGTGMTLPNAGAAFTGMIHIEPRQY